MSANAFRSPLMQQFASSARSQHRPPLVLSGFCSRNAEENQKNEKQTNRPATGERNASNAAHFMNVGHSSVKVSDISISTRMLNASPNRMNASFQHFTSHANERQTADSDIFEVIKNRRTSALGPIVFSDLPRLRESTTKAIQMATYGPNHYRTEPTTYYRIFADSASSHKLADICYNVSLCASMNRKPMVDAKKLAEDKRKKWLDTVACYITVTCAKQPIQAQNFNQDGSQGYLDASIDDAEVFQYWFNPIAGHLPETERQLENYASSCASIQNLLLSLHADNYASKWATGPVIRCRAFRSLIGCHNDEFVVGLVMVGTNKFLPTGPWTRRRDFDGDVLRDL